MSFTQSHAWKLMGRVGFWVARWPIGLIVRNSHRTRVFVVCGDQYLLVQHWLGDGRWMLPGGGLHRNELPLDGAKRELHEELGIAANNEQYQLIGKFKCRDKPFVFDYTLFTLKLTERPNLRLQSIEILSANWFQRTGPMPGKVSPELQNALAKWSGKL